MEYSAKPGSRKAKTLPLERVLSKLGAASRTEAARLIAAGRVTVNGRVHRDPSFPCAMGRDRITLDGVPLHGTERIYVAFHKPRGCVTTRADEKGRPTVYDHLPPDLKAMPVGRLDMASEGLLLFSNDTRWAQRIQDPATHLPKVYHVQTDRHLRPEELAAIAAGPVLDGVACLPVGIRVLRAGEKTQWLEITLTEGRNRQIRRMLALFGIEVRRLVRVAIGPLALGGLRAGQWRHLTAEERETLETAIRNTRRGAGKGGPSRACGTPARAGED